MLPNLPDLPLHGRQALRHIFPLALGLVVALPVELPRHDVEDVPAVGKKANDGALETGLCSIRLIVWVALPGDNLDMVPRACRQQSRAGFCPAVRRFPGRGSDGRRLCIIRV